LQQDCLRANQIWLTSACTADAFRASWPSPTTQMACAPCARQRPGDARKAAVTLQLRRQAVLHHARVGRDTKPIPLAPDLEPRPATLKSVRLVRSSYCAGTGIDGILRNGLARAPLQQRTEQAQRIFNQAFPKAAHSPDRRIEPYRLPNVGLLQGVQCVSKPTVVNE
jgi:hypothetical protein